MLHKCNERGWKWLVARKKNKLSLHAYLFYFYSLFKIVMPAQLFLCLLLCQIKKGGMPLRLFDWRVMSGAAGYVFIKIKNLKS